MLRIIESSLPLGAALAVALGALWGCGDESLAAPTGTAGIAAERPRPVAVAPVSSQARSQTMRFSGMVRAEQRAQLSFTIGGRLQARPVEVGDRVRRGQLLARLDGRPLHNAARTAEAQLRDARSRLAQLERDDARVTRLLDSRAANAEEAEKVRAGRESAAAAVDAAAAQSAEAGRMVTETRLIAPFDGTVTAVLMEPGEFAQPGLPVVAISGEDRLEVEIEVPESVRARLRVAAAVTVALPLAGLDSLTGTVKSIGRAGLGPGRLFPVIVALDPARPGDAGEVDAEPALVPGLTAQVTIATGTTAMTVVPVAAVVDPGGQAPAVYRVVAGRAERISVEVGALVGDAIAVRGGLTADDVVVIDGHASLIHGERVEVQP